MYIVYSTVVVPADKADEVIHISPNETSRHLRTIARSGEAADFTKPNLHSWTGMARKECRNARMIMRTTCVIWKRHSNLTIHGYLAIMPYG